jgi:hypothetical protein
MSPIELAKQLTAAVNKQRKMSFNDSPNQLMVDRDVFVRELVAEADDLWTQFNLSKQTFFSLGELGESFSDNGELPLYGRAYEATIEVIVQAHTIHGLHDGATGINHIVQKGPWISLHRSAS